MKFKDNIYIPENILLQWHITSVCNLNCVHCYEEDSLDKECRFSELLKIFDQFKGLLDFWRNSRARVKAHITLTGGEVFTHPSICELLQLLSSNKNYFTFSILTNGSLLNKANLKFLKKVNPKYIQISLEGSQETHDRIRGIGNYGKTLNAVKTLAKYRIPVLISFTAHRENYHDFLHVARIGRKLKAAKVCADRLIPQGRGSGMKDLTLSPAETMEFFKIMKQARIEAGRSLFNRTHISMHRALQFQIAGGRPYHCTAGDSLITIMPDGDLYPCRRMPVTIGNVFNKSLWELYYNDFFQSLRDKSNINNSCKKCFYGQLCRGGLKCLSYSLTGDPFSPDPGCWKVPALKQNDNDLCQDKQIGCSAHNHSFFS